MLHLGEVQFNKIPHSKQDRNVPLEGGKGKGLSGFAFPSLEEVIGTWEAINQCEGRDTLQYDAYTVYRSNNVPIPMEYYITDDGGHSWPGAEGKPWRGADDPSKVLDANKLIFDFFSTLK